MATGNSDNPHLPEELITLILLKLPVKSLLRFKSICKNWYEIIKSSLFTNNHLSHSRSNKGSLLVYHFMDDTKTFALDLFPDETLDFSYQDRYMQWAIPSSDILGPLNGVFCLFNGSDRVALWNPATRGIKLLPTSPTLIGRQDLDLHGHVHGFGLDPSTNNFKVVWIITNCADVESEEPVIVFVLVYNRGTDSWRQLDSEALNFNLDVLYPLSNTYLNGFYYWRAVDSYVDDDDEGDDHKRSIILSFDMVEEVFTEIEAPYMTTYPCRNLTLYNEHLALFIYDPSEVEKTIEIWVMESLGIWIKQVTIGPILNVMRPVGCWENGEVFFETNSRGLILYDPSGGREIKDIGTWGRRKLMEIFVYKESLVSVEGESVDIDEDGSIKTAAIKEFFAYSMDM